MAALERALAAPPVPVVRREPCFAPSFPLTLRQVSRHAQSAAAARSGRAGMEVDGEEPPRRGAFARGAAAGDTAGAGEARLRRVLGSSPGTVFKKYGRIAKKIIVPVHANTRKLRSMKKALKRGAPLTTAEE